VIKLSILICTIPERHNLLRRLTKILERQKTPEVEIRIHDAGRGTMSTGEKRNKLIESAEGEYFCFIDDDDEVPEYYVSEILKATESKPDVISFIGYMTTDKRNRQDFTIKLGSDYITKNNHHYRFPNHLCAFKRDLVKHRKFPHTNIGEDYLWAVGLQPLLKTEVHINKVMYIYDFISPQNRPGKIR
jgi:glycosyltransferase involved in cell wall biosynthesis